MLREAAKKVAPVSESISTAEKSSSESLEEQKLKSAAAQQNNAEAEELGLTLSH